MCLVCVVHVHVVHWSLLSLLYSAAKMAVKCMPHERPCKVHVYVHWCTCMYVCFYCPAICLLSINTLLPYLYTPHSGVPHPITILYTLVSSGEAVPGTVDHSNLSLSDVLADEGSEDSMFQQMVKNGDLLEGLEFPVDTLSQLPVTPPRRRAGTSDILSPPSNVSREQILVL